MNIREVIARRTDLGTFLVHLTRDGENQTARERLESILESTQVEARTPFGPAVAKLEEADQATESQKCVCFTETPLEHLYLLLEEIEGRQFEFAPYGIAITKKQGRSGGANPVWYLDITPGHDWLTVPIEELIRAAIQAGHFDDQPISKITPFVEQMGSGIGAGGGRRYRKEFWWEREWRKKGNFSLPHPFIVICPEDEIEHFRNLVDNHRFRLDAAFVSPTWGLEQIIANLAGFSRDDIEVF